MISDGRPRGTKVVNVDTGEVLEGVRSVRWECSYDQLSTLTLEVIDVPCEVETDSVIQKSIDIICNSKPTKISD